MKFIRVKDNIINIDKILIVSRLNSNLIEIMYDTPNAKSTISFEREEDCNKFYNELSYLLTFRQ